ncbi:hypothetical protein NL676_023808 [Syzygium grande]|nr:hypothetical protein NL676_023808 [Syzygium grande]
MASPPHVGPPLQHSPARRHHLVLALVVKSRIEPPNATPSPTLLQSVSRASDPISPSPDPVSSASGDSNLVLLMTADRRPPRARLPQGRAGDRDGALADGFEMIGAGDGRGFDGEG